MPNAQARYDELAAQIAELKKEFHIAGGALFREKAQALFDEFPTMSAFRWNQYTPYFNDGEECTFCVNEYSIAPLLGEIDEEFIEEYGDNDPEEGDSNYDTVRNIRTALTKFIQSFDEDILYEMFGDHATITIKRDGDAEVDAYEHE